MDDPHIVTPGKARENARNLSHAYAGFQAAAVILLVTHTPALLYTRLTLALFAISIPTTIAWGVLNRFTPEDEERNRLWVTSFILTFTSSVAAISILLASASVTAAVIFPVVSIAWFAVVAIRTHDNGVGHVDDKPK